MTIWKFGCRWDGNVNDFYKFIRDESIVIGHIPDANYALDDMVLIAKGFRILAIAQVDENPRSIIESEYRFLTSQYGIPWDSTSLFAKAEWYELPPSKQFEFRMQKGACRIHKPETVQTTLDLWNGRKR